MPNNVFNFFFSGISVVFLPKTKMFLFRFGAISIAAQNGGTSGHFYRLWPMIWGRHARTPHIEAVFRLMFVMNIESAKTRQSNEENNKNSTCVYLVSLDYEISVSHITRHSRLLWARSEKAEKAGKCQLRTLFSRKKKKTNKKTKSNNSKKKKKN